MTENQEANITGVILLGVALIAAGLAGNYFNFSLFLNIDFLFGSIFAMLALQFLGLGRGIVAAAIIASYTYFLWNHPYAIIIMTAEVAVVGWLMGRRKMGMVLADTLYWLFIGMPLAYFFFHVVMHIPFSNTSIVMTKQAVNGIANALVARLIFTGFTLWLRSSLTSYREIIYNLLAFFILCPALIMLAIGGRSDFNETDLRIRISLMQDSRRAARCLETWVMNRTSSIVNLADIAASISQQQMQSYLELTKKSDVNFLRIGLLDKEATITAYFPLLDELGQNNIGKNFADRPFIPTLKQTLKPMLSEVVMGRIGVPMPMVTMLAPVVIHGEYGGYITGILSLEYIQEDLDKSVHEDALLYTLIDKNGNVIMTNRTDQTVLAHFVRGKGTLNHFDAGISQWIPIASPNTSTMERWKNSFYVAETTIGTLAEWKLILEQPVASFQKTLNDNYTGKLTLLFLILLGALVLAEVLSRRSIVTLEKLRMITYDLPGRLLAESQEITWPESGVKETNHLINNFREMSALLKAQFSEIQQSNELLEQRVEERTEALRESEECLSLALKASRDAVWDWDLRANTLYYSPHWWNMVGYAENELKADPDLWRRLMHPDDLERASSIFSEAIRRVLANKLN
jgi:PAS domain-containing protein